MSLVALSSQCLLDSSFDLVDIGAEKLSCFFVQRIVRVRLGKEMEEAIDDGVDIQDGLPLFTQNVKTYVARDIYKKREKDDTKLDKRSQDRGGVTGAGRKHTRPRTISYTQAYYLHPNQCSDAGSLSDRSL